MGVTDVQRALQNVDTAKTAFINADTSNEDNLNAHYDEWKNAHKALSDSISESEKDTNSENSDAHSDATDGTDATSNPDGVSDAHPTSLGDGENQ